MSSLNSRTIIDKNNELLEEELSKLLEMKIGEMIQVLNFEWNIIFDLNENGQEEKNRINKKIKRDSIMQQIKKKKLKKN